MRLLADTTRVKPIDATIRLASLVDLEQIETCAQHAYAKYVARIGKKPAPMVADFASLIGEQCVHVAICTSTVAGYVVFYPVNKSMHLENVAVKPEFAGLGIGGQLIRYVESVATQQRLVAVELYTNEGMTENLSMYPALGYLETARKRQAGFNRVFYRKLL